MVEADDDEGDDQFKHLENDNKGTDDKAPEDRGQSF